MSGWQVSLPERWMHLRQALDEWPRAADVPPSGGRTHAERVATFLSFACWDHHVHGGGDHRMCDRAAMRLLAQHPEIAHDSIYTAVVCGELDDVRRIVAARPEAAREPGGPRGWTPLLLKRHMARRQLAGPPTAIRWRWSSS